MDRRRRIERWFAARGVPQLIEGYNTEPSMDRRALPLIVAWIVIGTYLIWARPTGAGPTQHFLVGTLALAATVAVLGAVLFLRRHPPFRRGRLDLFDIVLIGLVPGVAAAIVHRDPGTTIGVGGYVLLGVGVIYLVIGFGLIEIAVWAFGHLRAQLGQISTLVARTLPILLILVVFLLFASELWQAASTLGGADLAAVIALLLFVATVLVVTRARDEIRRLEADRGGDSAVAHLAGTPAEPLAAFVGPQPPRPLRWQERMNLVLLMLISQLVQSLFVGLLVTLFLLALGVLAIPATVQEIWVGGPVRTVLGFELLGEARLVSSELLITAGLLGGMCALYFTGLALTDASFRAEFHARVIADVEQILAVHGAYLASPEVRDETAQWRRRAWVRGGWWR